MTVGFYGPHCPYVCPKELFDYYDSVLPDIDDLDEFRGDVHPAIQQWYANRGVEDVTVKEARRVRAAYYGMVEYLDGFIGKIVDEISNTLGLENTVIIYASDHGDSLGENGLFWKSNFYEGSARVPMIFNCPGHFPGGVRIKGLTSLLDIAPTLIDMSNGERLPKMQGMSLLPVIMGKEKIDSQRSVIGQLADIKGDNPSAMIRKNNWKLVLHHGYEYPQLFDLSMDPTEKQDLGRDESYKEIIKYLVEELNRCWDVEAAIESKENFLGHLQILRAWVKATNFQGIEEWQGDISKNYLE
jgi:choline-sulfatase